MTRLFASAVTAGYGARDVLHDVGLSVAGGERVALVGPNGSGKTTLLRVLAGILRPSSGRVALDDVSIGDLPSRARARRIALVPQTFTTPFAFTVREVVTLGRTPYVGTFGRPAPADRDTVERAMDLVGCRALAERPISRLSGGERQRALIGMALAQEADVLLLDEPTVHLDPHQQREALEVLARPVRDRGACVVAVLHDLNLAAATADRIVVLAAGRIVADGPPAAVITPERMSSVFGAGLFVGMRAGVPFVLPEPLGSPPGATRSGWSTPSG
ncbi:MAG: ABC transporter ATP-binding protein [Chloroflexi bacterium]|nr:ABC transporter ATP-binding protein [Chloroflexota bacterium]